MFPDAIKMASAIGRSKYPPDFGKSAGDKLTSTRLTGNVKPLFMIAARCVFLQLAADGLLVVSTLVGCGRGSGLG